MIAIVSAVSAEFPCAVESEPLRIELGPLRSFRDLRHVRVEICVAVNIGCRAVHDNRTRLESAFLLQKNLHVLKVKGHRIGLEEIVADHASQVEAKGVFPRERPII